MTPVRVSKRRMLLRPEHPNAPPCGQMARARIVAAEMLGRRLLPGEEVNHRNRDQSDDRPENLEVFRTHREHMIAERRAHAALDCRRRLPREITHMLALRQPGEPLHPGVIFRLRYRGRLNLLQRDAAQLLGSGKTGASRFERGELKVSKELADRLATITNKSPAFWLGLQARYDAHKSKKKRGDT